MKRCQLAAIVALLGLCCRADAQDEASPARYTMKTCSFWAQDDAWTAPNSLGSDNGGSALEPAMGVLAPDAQVPVGSHILTFESRPFVHEGVKIVTRENRASLPPLWDGLDNPTDPRIIPTERLHFTVRQDKQTTIGWGGSVYYESLGREGEHVRKAMKNTPGLELSMTVSPSEDGHVRVAVEQEASLRVGWRESERIRAERSTEGSVRVPLGHWIWLASDLDTKGHAVTFLQVTEYPGLETGLQHSGDRTALLFSGEMKVLRVPAASSAEIADALVVQLAEIDDGVSVFDSVKPRVEEFTTIDQVIEWLGRFEGVLLVTAPRVTTLAAKTERKPSDEPVELTLPSVSGRAPSWPPFRLGTFREEPAIVIDTRNTSLGMEHVATSSESRESPVMVWYGIAMSFWCNPSSWENPSVGEDRVDIGYGYHHRSREEQPRRWWQSRQPPQVEDFSFHRELRVPKNGWVGFTYEMATTGDRIIILLLVDEVEPGPRFVERPTAAAPQSGAGAPPAGSAEEPGSS